MNLGQRRGNFHLDFFRRKRLITDRILLCSHLKCDPFHKSKLMMQLRLVIHSS